MKTYQELEKENEELRTKERGLRDALILATNRLHRLVLEVKGTEQIEVRDWYEEARAALAAHPRKSGKYSTSKEWFEHHCHDEDGVDFTIGSIGCTLAPKGWYCTRDKGHEGPCAAHPRYSTCTASIVDRQGVKFTCTKESGHPGPCSVTSTPATDTLNAIRASMLELGAEEVVEKLQPLIEAAKKRIENLKSAHPREATAVENMPPVLEIGRDSGGAVYAQYTTDAPIDWKCPTCQSHSSVFVDEPKSGGGYQPSTTRRCCNCKELDPAPVTPEVAKEVYMTDLDGIKLSQFQWNAEYQRRKSDPEYARQCKEVADSNGRRPLTSKQPE